MIAKHMKELTESGSAIRAMFEEGKKMARERGKDHVFDFSLGNPNTPPPEKIKEAGHSHFARRGSDPGCMAI